MTLFDREGPLRRIFLLKKLDHGKLVLAFFK